MSKYLMIENRSNVEKSTQIEGKTHNIYICLMGTESDGEIRIGIAVLFMMLLVARFFCF